MTELIPLIFEICVFISLCIAYYKLCTHRQISKVGKVAEIITLYLVTVSAYLGSIRFFVWALLIAIIGAVKLLTTKKQKSERKSIGNNF